MLAPTSVWHTCGVSFSPVPVAHPAALAAFTADLQRAKWDVDHVNGLLGAQAQAALLREQRVPALQAARAVAPGTAGAARALLTRLFILGDTLSEAELQSALPTAGRTGAQRLGLVAATTDGWQATVDLRPHSAFGAEQWFASDRSEMTAGTALAPTHVLGVGGASATLAAWTIRESVAGGRHGLTIDVGTGCGIQALQAAHFSAAVIGTDISARALQFARFNAALNGADVEWRAGSLLAPVAECQADLIVSNPPFVITPPELTLPLMEYRDGGWGGDRLVAELVAGLGACLAPGGVAQLLANWEHHQEQPWQQRVATWLPPGVNAWVVQREVLDPAEYVEMWLRDGGLDPRSDRPTYEQHYSEWLADFRVRAVQGIGFGQIILHRPPTPGPTWQRLEHVDSLGTTDPASHVLATLRVGQQLAALDDTELAAATVCVAADVVEERYTTPGTGELRLMRLAQGGGLARRFELGTAEAAVVGACDGELPIGVLCDAVAGLLEADAAAVRAACLPLIRDLLFGGLLELVHPAKGSQK